MNVLEGKPGIEHIVLEDWREFIDFIDKVKKNYQYIWRGQSDSTWDLKSSFDRLWGIKPSPQELKSSAEEHLKRFKYIVRGRIEYDNICDKNDDEMWALAQHYGLATPLLDWTYSPFVALFFAIHNQLNKNKKIAIWGLANLDSLNKIAAQNRKPSIDRFNPLQKNNPRLMSQNALFTKVPLGYTVNGWIEFITQENAKYSNTVYLYKIDIEFSSKDIEECLMLLNRMNINSYTLFPDADGVTKFCNMAFRIPRYHRFW